MLAEIGIVDYVVHALAGEREVRAVVRAGRGVNPSGAGGQFFAVLRYIQSFGRVLVRACYQIHRLRLIMKFYSVLWLGRRTYMADEFRAGFSVPCQRETVDWQRRRG